MIAAQVGRLGPSTFFHAEWERTPYVWEETSTPD